MESKFKNHFRGIKLTGWIRIYLLSALIACSSQNPQEGSRVSSEDGKSKGFGISIDTSGKVKLDHETSTPTVTACIPSCRSSDHSRESRSSTGGLGEVVISFVTRVYGAITGGSRSSTSDSSGALTKEISNRFGQRDYDRPSPKNALTVQKTEVDSVVYRSMDHARTSINNELTASVDKTNITLIQAAVAVTQLQDALTEAAQAHNQKIKELATSQEELLTALESLPQDTLKTLAGSQGGRQIRDLLRYMESRKSYVDANPMLPLATKQELMNLAAASALYADELFVRGEMEEAQWVVDGTYALVELAIGLSPVGRALDLYQIITGLDLQGNDIGESGRILASASLLTFGTAKMMKSSDFAVGIIKNLVSRIKNVEKSEDIGEVLGAGAKILDSAKEIGWGADELRAIAKSSSSIERFGPINKGILHDIPNPSGGSVADTFRSSSYFGATTKEPLKLYRVYSEGIGEFRAYWSRTKPTGPLQAQLDAALDPNWGNRATKWTEITVPPGETIFEGAASDIILRTDGSKIPTGRLLGGGNQVYVNKIIPSSWKTDGGAF